VELDIACAISIDFSAVVTPLVYYFLISFLKVLYKRKQIRRTGKPSSIKIISIHSPTTAMCSRVEHLTTAQFLFSDTQGGEWFNKHRLGDDGAVGREVDAV
jgi:hypothetical protein